MSDDIVERLRARVAELEAGRSLSLRHPAAPVLADIESELEAIIKESPYYPRGQSWHPDLTLRSACRSDSLAGLYRAWRLVNEARIQTGDEP
jgi:hypothetical protein